MLQTTRIIFWVLCFLFSLPAVSQEVFVQLNVNPNLTPYVYEWEGAAANDLQVITEIPGTQPVNLVYRIWLLDGDNNEIANSNPGETPPIFLDPGFYEFPLAEVFPVSSLNYIGEYEMEIAQTGQLPEGNYVLCIEALQAGNFQPISQPSCAPFIVTGFQDPFNIFPPEDQEIDIAVVPNIVFQWSPVAPEPEFGSIYLFKVVEIYAGQSMEEAIVVNPSILNEEIQGETQYNIPIDFVPFEPNESGFAWTVIPLNQEGLPYTVPNGQSTPSRFYVTESTTDPDCECISCELTGMNMLVNGVESTNEMVPANQSVSFVPEYVINCSDPSLCPASFEGSLTLNYSSQQFQNQDIVVASGEDVSFPGAGLLYISWQGTAYCGEAICECEGNYGPVQWQVSGADIIEDPDGTTEGETEDDEDITGLPDGTIDPDNCTCGSCYLQSVQFFDGGEPLEGNGLPTGRPLSLDAQIVASCNPSSCAPVYQGYFRIGYTPNGGSWTEEVLTGPNDTFILPEGISVVVVDFVGQVLCNNEVCPCEGAINLEFFVEKLPDIPEDDGPPVPEEPRDSLPPEKVPPDSLRDKCLPALVRLDQASPIDLGMVLDDPSTFPYPRAVPIRAEGIDWDYAIFQCEGCEGGQSEIQYPVKDLMNLGNYRWEILSGPGSLGDPFRADSIQAAEDKLEALLAELEAKRDHISALEERLNSGIDADSAKYGQMLTEVENGLEILQERLEIYEDSLASLNEIIGELEGQKTVMADSLSLSTDSIGSAKERISVLEELLSNPMSEPEKVALSLAETKANEWKEARQAVIDFETSMAEATSQINENLENLKEEERIKAETYVLRRNEILSLTRYISDLEDQLYNTAPLRKFQRTRSKFNQKYRAFYGSYVAGTNQALIWDPKKETIDDGARVLAITAPGNRGDQYDNLHTEILGFATLPSIACNGVASEEYSSCTSLSSDLLEATFDFDTALSKLNSSSSQLNANVMNQIQSARDSLSNIEGSLDGYRTAAQQAAINYQNASVSALAQLIALEEEKKDLIEAMDLAEHEAGQADSDYQIQKTSRIKAFEENRPKWEESLAFAKNTVYQYATIEKYCIDSLIVLQAELDSNYEIKEVVEFEKKALEDEIKKYEDLITNLKKKLDALKDEPEEIEKEIAQLEAEIEALLDSIKSAEKEKERLSQPKKFAKGPEVYYIPPPLEKVLEINGKYPEFEEWVEKVDSARLALDVAIAEKAQVQSRLTQLTDKVSWDLLSYKNSSENLKVLNTELDSLRFRLAGAQQEVAIDHVGDQSKLQTKLDTALARMERAKERAEEAEDSEAEKKEKVDEIKEACVAQRDILNGQREAVSTASSQLNYQEGLSRNSAGTLRERSKKVSDQREVIKQIELDIGRVGNARTIAQASTDDAPPESTESELNSLNEALETEETKLEQFQSELSSIESSHQANTLALNNAARSLQEADSLLRVEKKKMYALEDSLLAAFDEAKKISTNNAYWEKEAKEWERKANQIREAMEEKKDEIGAEIDDNENVQEIEQSIEELEASIKELEENMSEKSSSITEGASDAEKLKEEAREKVIAAREKKEEIEEEFRQWLKNEFETVFLEVQLELRGDDQVADGWRSDDGQAVLIKKLMYPNNRIPVLQNKYASGSLPELPKGAPCQIELDFRVGSEPKEFSPPSPKGPEPRTIALVYENGRPLWKEWPVIAQDEKRFLQKDVIFLTTEVIPDFDELIYECSAPPNCEGIPPLGRGIRDVGTYDWKIKRLVNSNSSKWRYSIWETQEVEKPKTDEEQELESIFSGDLIVGDKPVSQKSKYKVYPGVLLEVPDTLYGVPDTTAEVLGRIVAGDHKGLVAEKVEFSCQLISGQSESYGFGNDTLINIKTDGDGYAKTDFSFGDGYASFKVYVKWYRGSVVVEEDEIFLIAPLEIKIHKVGPGPPEPAWRLAAEIINGGAINLESAEENLPNCVYDGESEISEECQRELRCVAGLLDYNKDFVNEELTLFEVDDESIRLEGVSDTTEYFGIGHTLLKDVAEGIEAEVTASIEEKYLPVGRPGIDKSGLSTEMIEEFYIGEEGLPFLVLLDNPVPVGTIVNGTGMLGVSGEGFSIGLMIPLQQVKLEIKDVTLEEGDDGYLATAGSVIWEGEGNVKASVLSFELEAKKLAISASLGATIEGSVKHEINFPDAIEFSGTFEPSGDFIATISNLPEVEIADFTLKEGAAIGLDMHSSKGPTESGSFKGVFVPTATLELPESFANGTTGERSTISVTEFYVGTSGLGGTISIEGDFFSLGYGGYALQGKALAVTIVDNSLESFEAGCNIVLGNPFQGDLGVGIAYSGEKFIATLETEKPVSLPRLNAVFNIIAGSGIFVEGEKYSLTINALVKSDHIGDLSVNKLVITSDGAIKAENIGLDGDIKFGSGFKIQNPQLSFAFSSGEYSVALAGKVILPKLDSTYVSGTVSLSPGPTLGVSIDAAQVTFEYGPVSFTGSFAFNSEEFRGDFDVGLKNLANGIEGFFVFGNRPTADEQSSFGYWYAELGVPVKIPLGQTGISLLKLGGGLGYNYVPPMGDADGIATEGGGLAFKAFVGFGNTPSGKVCAGEVAMTITSSAFSLYGRVWVLDKRESFFGEGQITISWEPPKVDGFIGMGIKLVSADGELIDFDGNISFLFSPDDFYIKSNKLEGNFIQAINAEGKIDINTTRLFLGGKIFYDLNTSFDFTDSERIEVVLNVSAGASIEYLYNVPSLSANANFSGNWRVTFVNRIYDLNITSGSIELAASVFMNNQYIKLNASADISWDFWIASGSMNCDFGYQIDV